MLGPSWFARKLGGEREEQLVDESIAKERRVEDGAAFEKMERTP